MSFLKMRAAAFSPILLAATFLLIGGALKTFADEAATYGAVAYSEKNGAWGISDPSSDEEGANKNAIDFCAKYGEDCKIVLPLKNTCVAISIGNKGEVTWASADAPEEARREAQTACISKSNDACELKRWTCYTPK